MSTKKRILSLGLAITLLASTANVAFADTSDQGAVTQSIPATGKVTAYLKPDVTVRYNSIPIEFSDVNGVAVYPIIYNGSTYLPVRAISELMGENIEWNDMYKSVYIGKTLENPGKSISKTNSERKYAKESPNYTALPSSATFITVYLKPNVSVLYDFEMQDFRDAQDRVIYPIIYNGSAYLPVRAVSALMGEEIIWDNKLKTVFIGSQTPVEEEEEKVRSEAVSQLQNVFDKEIDLFDDATAKISSIAEKETTQELSDLAIGVTADYAIAQNYNRKLKALDTDDYTRAELKAYKKLSLFMDQTEYYILILENIAYMAAAESDYSMLAEAFYTAAIETSAAMDEARAAIEDLEDEDD